LIHFSVFIVENIDINSGVRPHLGINDGEVLAGNIPPKQRKLIQAWIELHRDELLADWELAQNGEEPFRIAPLQ
jgi:hypothetical protein